MFQPQPPRFWSCPGLGWCSSLSTYVEHGRVEEQGQGRHQVVVTPLLHLREQPEGTGMSCRPGAPPKISPEVPGDSSPQRPSSHDHAQEIPSSPRERFPHFHGKTAPKAPLTPSVGQAEQHNLLLCLVPGLAKHPTLFDAPGP